MTETTRRTVIFSAGGAGMAAVLTACGGYGEPAESGGDTSATSASQAPEAAETSAGADPGGSANALAKTADIPEGGGKIFKDQKIVITQPAAGEFKAFSSVCTHQGCDVDKIEGDTIDCPCHGSKFKITDGSVANGPATDPLEEKAIKVDGDSIVLA
ncbi:Rieske (2Fe-2S) protein [Streptosporangium sp. NPDC000563]|uniref:Rieske (2Fe-2S) protein n=1 Tax=unclassified Streptosporangium TaxID=2632669 RepID=UPI00331E3404